MPAATRPDVNPAPLIHVDAASVSIARDGSYELLLITGMKHVRCCIPMAVGLHVFQVTNPAAHYVPKEKRSPRTATEREPALKPNGKIL